MKILFLGLLFCEESLKEAYKSCRGGVQMAPHLFESRLISGLVAEWEGGVEVLSVPPIGSFPMHYKKLRAKGIRKEGYTQIGYLNLPGIKHKIQARKLYRAIKKMVKKEPVSIVTYSFYEPFLVALSRLRRRFPDLHITLLQPDAIPGRNGMIKSEKMVRRGDRLVRLADCANDFVFLSALLSEAFDMKGRPYCVVDCLCDPTQPESKKKEKSENVFLYTGTTARAYGICEMVDCFAKIPEASLWICGSGDSDEYIRRMAQKHPNIRHFGYLSQTEVARLRDECDFLLNPRIPTGTYTRYSFPSKTAEYLLSGKPVVMYHLEGLGEEYADLLTYLTKTTPEELEAELRSIISLPYEALLEKAARARTHMLEKKNANVQAKVILDMLTKGARHGERL